MQTSIERPKRAHCRKCGFKGADRHYLAEAIEDFRAHQCLVPCVGEQFIFGAVVWTVSEVDRANVTLTNKLLDEPFVLSVPDFCRAVRTNLLESFGG
jgi:hypothetical protein